MSFNNSKSKNTLATVRKNTKKIASNCEDYYILRTSKESKIDELEENIEATQKSIENISNDLTKAKEKEDQEKVQKITENLKAETKELKKLKTFLSTTKTEYKEIMEEISDFLNTITLPISKLYRAWKIKGRTLNLLKE